MKKKVIYIFIVVLLFFILLPITTLAADDTISIKATYDSRDEASIYKQNSTVHTNDTSLFAQGTGTLEDPYGISTPEELNAIRLEPNAHYILLNDIDITAVTSEGGEFYNDGAGWEPISVFEGVFDGGGYRIIGLNLGRPNAAFIDILEENAVLKNLGVVDGTIHGMYAAGLVCNNYGLVVDSYNTCDISVNSPNSRGGGIVAINEGIIRRCYNIGSVEGKHDFSAVGGIVGMNYYVVCDSYNAGLIKGISDDDVGGIAGISYKVLTEGTLLITNCYNVGEIEAPYPGGIIGKLKGGLLIDSYFINTAESVDGLTSYTEMIIENVHKLSSEQMQIQETFETFDFEHTWEMPTEGDYLYPILQTNITIPTSGLSNNFAGGIGTDADPYQISNPQQLNAVRDYRFSSFILVNDIDLSAATSEGGEYYYGGKGWEPLGNVAYPFEGSFDGGGYNIGGLNMSRYNPDSIGLFGVADGATIRNINVEVNIQGDCRWVGSIVGMAMSTTISECHTSGAIRITREWGLVGGIVGYSDNEIELCHNEAQVTGTDDNCQTGGIVGVNDSGVVQKNYNTGTVLGYNNAGVVSYNKGSIVDCYNAAEINGSSIVYENIGSVERCYSSGQSRYFAKVLNGSFDNCYYVDSPINLQADFSGIIKKTNLELQQEATYEGFDFSNVWTFAGSPQYLYSELIGNNHDSEVEEPTVFAGGDGTAEDPYLVATPLQLNAVRKYEDSHFLMANDIDMTEETSEGGVFYNDGDGWEPIYELFGSFDGNGHSIIGLNMNGGVLSRGAFIYSLKPNGCLKNLTIADSVIIAKEAAAFAGYNGGLILDCVNSSTIEGDRIAGGITCTSGGLISKCSNVGDVYVDYGDAGGISGSNSGGIRDCYNYGSVTALDGYNVGGIVGEISDYGLGGVVENCYNIGEIDGGRFNPGGIFGSAEEDCSVLNCYYLDNTLRVEGGNSGCYVFNNLRVQDAQMRLQSTYSTFDFDYIWEMPIGGEYAYPILQTGVEKPSVGPSDYYAGGIGSPEDPYQISTPSQLNAVRLNPRSSFVLINDIDLTSSTSIGGDYYDEGKGWYPIGNNAYRFEGTFDGAGYEITGIHINRTEQLNLGLFGIVENAKIENVGVNVDISGNANAVGGMVGIAIDAEITGCYTDGIIKASYSNGLAGGISGRSIRTTIGQCYNKATLFTLYLHQKVAGITGENDSGDISECYNIGYIDDRGDYSMAAGIAAINSGTVSDCYNAGYVKDSGIVGSSSGSVFRCYNIGQAMGITANPSGTIENCYYLEPSFTAQDEYDGIFVKTDEQMQSQSTFEHFSFGSVWTIGSNPNYPYPELINNTHDINPNEILEFEGGDGTEENPYQISTPVQLNAVGFNREKYFVMINDIDLQAATSKGGEFYNSGLGWIPVCEFYPFLGSFDGQGFRIHGIGNSQGGLFGIIGDENNIGLYGKVSNTHVEFSDCELRSEGLFASANFGEISYSSASGTTHNPNASFNQDQIAGFVENNWSQIHHCYNDASFQGYSVTNGIATINKETGVIKACYNAANLESSFITSGIVRYNLGLVEDCYNVNNLHADNMVAGIIGDTNIGTVRTCYNIGGLESEGVRMRIAGIVIDNSGTVDTCYYLNNSDNAVYEENGTTLNTFSKSTNEMKQQSTFAGFDFVDVWEINEAVSPPVLKGVDYTYASGIVLDKESLILFVGENQTLSAIISPEDVTNLNVEWTSSDENIATIANGVVTGINGGKATISVTTVDGGFTDICEVTVAVPVTGVGLDKSTSNLLVGETDVLTATVSPSEATDKSVTWFSNNEIVATVENGVVSAHSPGEAIISITTVDGGFVAECTIKVTQIVTGVELSTNEINLAIGQTEILIESIIPSDATNRNVAWSSSNEGVASVDGDGNVLAISTGTTTVKVTTQDGNYFDTCTVNVTQPVTGVNLDETEITLVVEQTETLKETISPSDATNKNVTWSSSNEGIVLVDGTGNVSAISAGSAIIKVTTQDGNYFDTCTVNVIQTVTGVSLDETEITLVVGHTETLKETISPSDATNKNVSWSSSNEGIALVDENGNVSAISAGSVTITVTTQDSSYTDTCTVTVESAKIESSVYTVGADGYLNGIIIGSTAGQLIANLDNDSADINIFDQNGNEVAGGPVFTGMTVKLIISGTVRDELTVIILGDANGDGGISITDYTLARLDILGLKSLGQTAAKAADINGDGKVSITDYTLMRLDILGLKKIH